jgi:hypothetical protein
MPKMWPIPVINTLKMSGTTWAGTRPLTYLPATDAPTAGVTPDVEQACDVLRGVHPVIGSLASARVLGLVGAVRSHLGAYPQVPAVQELERDLHQCMAS